MESTSTINDIENKAVIRYKAAALFFLLVGVSFLLTVLLEKKEVEEFRAQVSKEYNSGYFQKGLLSHIEQAYFFSNYDELQWLNQELFDCVSISILRGDERVFDYGMNCDQTVDHLQLTGRLGIDSPEDETILTYDVRMFWAKDNPKTSFLYGLNLFNAYMAILLFLSLALSLIWFLNEKRKRKIKLMRKLIEQGERERERQTERREEIFHEIRTPLNIIRQNAKHIISRSVRLNDNINPEDVEVVLKSIVRMASVIDSQAQEFSNNDFLSYLDSENAIESSKKKANLPKMLLKTIEHSYGVVGSRVDRPFLDFSYDSSIPEELEIYHQDVQLIVRNLLNNAIKNTMSGYGIRMQVLARKKDLVIRIEDLGIGMSPEEQEKAFIEGYTTFSHVMEGSGKGLSMVIKRVEAHNFKLRCDSEKGKGTTMELIIPDAIHEDRGEQGNILDNRNPIKLASQKVVVLISPMKTNGSWDRRLDGLFGLAQKIYSQKSNITFYFAGHSKGKLTNADVINPTKDVVYVVLDPPSQEFVINLKKDVGDSSIKLLFEVLKPFYLDVQGIETIESGKYSSATVDLILDSLNVLSPDTKVANDFVNYLKGKNCLVVDDCPATYETISYILEDYGINPIYRQSSSKLIKEIEQDLFEHSIAFAIIDYKMKDNLDGVETIKKLREYFQNRVMLCLYTANTNQDFVDQVYGYQEQGVIDYIMFKDGDFDLSALNQEFYLFRERNHVLHSLDNLISNASDNQLVDADINKVKDRVMREKSNKKKSLFEAKEIITKIEVEGGSISDADELHRLIGFFRHSIDTSTLGSALKELEKKVRGRVGVPLGDEVRKLHDKINMAEKLLEQQE